MIKYNGVTNLWEVHHASGGMTFIIGDGEKTARKAVKLLRRTEKVFSRDYD